MRVSSGNVEYEWWAGPVSPCRSKVVELVESGRLMIGVSRKELNRMQYPIVVSMWDHAVGPHSYGRMRRAWLSEFTPAERKCAGRLHSRFYRWYLRSGTPDVAVMRADTIAFIERLVRFFATA